MALQCLPKRSPQPHVPAPRLCTLRRPSFPTQRKAKVLFPAQGTQAHTQAKIQKKKKKKKKHAHTPMTAPAMPPQALMKSPLASCFSSGGACTVAPFSLGLVHASSEDCNHEQARAAGQKRQPLASSCSCTNTSQWLHLARAPPGSGLKPPRPASLPPGPAEASAGSAHPSKGGHICTAWLLEVPPVRQRLGSGGRSLRSLAALHGPHVQALEVPGF